jgi:hypothetical protein
MKELHWVTGLQFAAPLVNVALVDEFGIVGLCTTIVSDGIAILFKRDSNTGINPAKNENVLSICFLESAVSNRCIGQVTAYHPLNAALTYRM